MREDRIMNIKYPILNIEIKYRIQGENGGKRKMQGRN
jgi:hypothetical protein